jgi:hypothetical protein
MGLVISLRCIECSSSGLRPSRLRLKDVERLLLLQYPIRCRRCRRRDYVGLQRVLWQAWKARSKAPEACQKA